MNVFAIELSEEQEPRTMFDLLCETLPSPLQRFELGNAIVVPPTEVSLAERLCHVLLKLVVVGPIVQKVDDLGPSEHFALVAALCAVVNELSRRVVVVMEDGL